MRPLFIPQIPTEAVSYVPTLFGSLDEAIRGFCKSNLIVVGGRPAMGVRSFVLTMACRQAWQGHKVACFFMSLTTNNLVERTNHIYEYYKQPKMSVSPAFYLEPQLSIDSLRSEIERLKNDGAVDIVYVESLQGIGLGDSTIDPLSQSACAVKALWRISRDFDIPVVALSALSRAPEHRGMGCKPLLTDLRESSMIEVCADMVLLLYRPAYYDINEDPRGNSLTNYAEINVAKNNNGRCTNVALRYEEPCVFADGGDLRVVI